MGIPESAGASGAGVASATTPASGVITQRSRGCAGGQTSLQSQLLSILSQSTSGFSGKRAEFPSSQSVPAGDPSPSMSTGGCGHMSAVPLQSSSKVLSQTSAAPGLIAGSPSLQSRDTG